MIVDGGEEEEEEMSGGSMQIEVEKVQSFSVVVCSGQAERYREFRV